MNPFRTLLLDIGQHLTKDNLSNLKYACSGFIPAGRAEGIKQPLDLFLEMERQNKLTEHNREILADLLVRIGRNDLRNKLLEIRDEPPPPRQGTRNPSTRLLNEKATRDMFTELNLAERISINWKFLGRYLKLADYIIRNIEDTYSRTEERSHEMLIKWLQSSSDNSVNALVIALKKAGRTDLAEDVEEYCINKNGPLTDMTGLRDNLPTVEPNIEQPVRGNQSQPAEHHERQQQRNLHDGIEADGAVPVRPKPEQDVSEPVQVSEDPEDDLKKMGSFRDQTFYTICDLIGSGGYSRVYCVMEKKSNKQFAVKTVELGVKDKITQERVEALEKEVSMLRVLDNPYIVKYHKSEAFDDLVAVLMEYMPGGSIATKIINDGVIEELTVRKYTWQILNGLKYLHANKVIHRDIKGANILLDKDHKNVKLTDFGISVPLEGIATSTGHCVSNQQGMVASVFWTSPELLSCEKYSFNTDIWSLGCTVIEMLTGDPPFRKDGHTIVQIMFRITNHKIQLPEDLSSYAKGFLAQCFKQRDERPSASVLLSQEDDAFPVISDD